ncbi:MAG: hypothetical protein ACO1OX_04510 [Novosphingobium sp.]
MAYIYNCHNAVEIYITDAQQRLGRDAKVLFGSAFDSGLDIDTDYDLWWGTFKKFEEGDVVD